MQSVSPGKDVDAFLFVGEEFPTWEVEGEENEDDPRGDDDQACE
jgi:hypothetical protein